jgi:hypothetical protein
MFGFGRKKMQMTAAVATFVQHIFEGVNNSLPEIREAIQFGGGILAKDDAELFGEVFPAALAIGLQPISNIWDAATFERARQETVRLIDGFNRPELTDNLKLRLDQHLQTWRKATPTKGGNMPWDDVTCGVLSSLGVARVGPIAIMGVSSILTEMTGMFWKNVEAQFKLS